MAQVICVLIVCSVLSGVCIQPAFSSYPPDPASDTEWPSSSENSVADVQTRFNTARTNENIQLGISIPMMTLPSQEVWDSMGNGAKALWLINCEREDRGVAPLDGLEANAAGVAQYYAQYLMDNNAFSHNADGKTPWERLNSNPAIGACHDSLVYAENISVLWGGWTLPLERSVYMWTYDDSGSTWNHRRAILYYPYNENGGSPDSEGFLGIGHANGTLSGWSDSDIFVMNIFDPCSVWDYTEVAGDVNGDYAVNLLDVITALQVMAGIDVLPLLIGGDVDGDCKIGSAEAAFGLQKAAQIR